MPKLAVEFEPQGSRLLLVYNPRNDDSWVQDKFARGDELVIKGTFHLRGENLVTGGTAIDPEAIDAFLDAEPLRFVIARKIGEYYKFDPGILPVGYPVLIHCEAPMTWKWFTAEQRTSIFRIIADLRPSRIVIGGPETDAIPIAEFEKLIVRFPTSHELKRYVLARVSLSFESTQTQLWMRMDCSANM